MGDQECLSLAETAGTRILTINGQTIMVNGTALKLDSMGGTDLFSVLQSAGVTAEDAAVPEPQAQSETQPVLMRDAMEIGDEGDGGFLFYYDNDASELQSMQITPDQAVALGLDEPEVQTPVLDEPPPLAITQAVLDKAMKPPITFSIRLQTTAPKIRPPPLQIVSGPIIPPPGKVAIPRPTDEARIIRTIPNSFVRSTKVIPRILATPTAALPAAPPLVPFSKSVLKVNLNQESAKFTTSPQKQITLVSKPLGSSENPIQLVQHGHTYHSVQPLNPDQLKQISTVLQQKQIDTSRNTKNVLFDESTNTKIIYRVVYPENQEVKKTVEKPPPRKRGRPSKIKKPSDDEDYIESDITKGEKEERKKLIPRTRSGRLSRPPRHMVKDYKRIHHLDFAEPDLDDSDGGYSDYQISDSELVQPDQFSNDTSTNNEPLKTPKLINSRFRCPTCQKIYLGYKRLTQHFTQYPEHGSIDALPQQLPPEHGKIKLLKKKKTKKAMANAETKNKIKKFLANCDPSEVTEIAAGAVAQSLDLWDMLLLKVSLEKGEKSRTETMLAELDALLEKAKENVANIMLNSPASIEEEDTEALDINITSSTAAVALNAPCGIFKILKSEDEKLCWIPPQPEAMEEHASPSPEAEMMPQLDTNPMPQNEPTVIPQSDSLPIQDSMPLSHSDQIIIPLEEDDVPSTPSPVKLDSFDLPVNALEGKIVCALNSTLDSEKPSDTSMLSDTPLDEIVSAELNNLVSKSGISDFVSPPDSNPVAVHIFSDQSSVFHDAVEMDLAEVKQDLMDHSGFDSLTNHHSLDQSGLVGAPHEVDFEALSEEFNRNTQA